MTTELTKEEKQRNRLSYCGVSEVTAARWYCLLNCGEWPDDFPIEMPAGYFEMPENERFLRSIICLHGIEDFVPKATLDQQWMGHTCMIAEDGFARYWFPDGIGCSELVHTSKRPRPSATNTRCAT